MAYARELMEQVESGLLDVNHKLNELREIAYNERESAWMRDNGKLARQYNRVMASLEARQKEILKTLAKFNEAFDR